MGNNDCWCLLAAVISLFIGVILGVVYYFGLLPAIATPILILVILAAVFLITLVYVGAFAGSKIGRCICGNGNCLLSGIIGTIIFGIVALALELTAVTIARTVIVAIFGLFAALFITAVVIFVKCIIEANCRCRD